MKIYKNDFLLKICLLFIFMANLFSFFMLDCARADTFWDQQIGMDVASDEVGYAYGERVSDRNDVRDVRLVVANIIKIFLGFMGIIFLVLIIYGGFIWMTASGQEDKINKARSLLITGIIGLIIVVSSFAIAELITDKIFMATVASI